MKRSIYCLRTDWNKVNEIYMRPQKPQMKWKFIKKDTNTDVHEDIQNDIRISINSIIYKGVQNKRC